MTTTSPKTTKSSKTGSSQEDPVDMTTSDSNVGDKRKVTETTNSKSNAENEEEGGKDLVEKKQTTLDDIVHSEKDNQPAESKSKSEERPAKKSKTEESSTEVKDEVKEREEKVKEREEKVRKKEEKVDKDVEMKTSPSKSESKSKSTTESDKPTTSTSTSASNPESQAEKTTATTDTQAPKSDQTPSEPPAATTSKPAENVNGTTEETIPGDEAHLDHPENWTTGGDPATDKQKGFLKVLEKQKGVPVGDLGGIGKSEASEKIDELKNMCEYIHRLESL